jgi:hypothetical protein
VGSLVYTLIRIVEMELYATTFPLSFHLSWGPYQFEG